MVIFHHVLKYLHQYSVSKIPLCMNFMFLENTFLPYLLGHFHFQSYSFLIWFYLSYSEFLTMLMLIVHCLQFLIISGVMYLFSLSYFTRLCQLWLHYFYCLAIVSQISLPTFFFFFFYFGCTTQHVGS